MYLSEGELSSAYILFMRYLTLFVEKIVKHPNLKEVPADVKKAHKAKLLEIMPITETLKKKLLIIYEKEYEQYLKDQENERQRAIEEAKRKVSSSIPFKTSQLISKFQEIEDAARNKASSGGSVKPYSPTVVPSAPDLSDLDKIVYPNDFPHDLPNKDPQKSAGLLPGTRPSFDRTAKPSLSWMEGALRTVKIPEDTMQKFLDVARANTLRNVETCGILAGQLKQHQLHVTHVILPKQSGTSDSCNTMNEEEIFDIQDQLNLITLGWIHTHPSQTAFLSSVDLHTQAGYQIMMPEVSSEIFRSAERRVSNFSLMRFHFRQSQSCVLPSTKKKASSHSRPRALSSSRSALKLGFTPTRTISLWRRFITRSTPAKSTLSTFALGSFENFLTKVL